MDGMRVGDVLEFKGPFVKLPLAEAKKQYVGFLN